jgi:hypothetical protein
MMESVIVRVGILRKKNSGKPIIVIQGQRMRDIGFEEGKTFWIEHNAERILLRLDDGTMPQEAHKKPYKTPRTVAVRHDEQYREPRIALLGKWLYEVGFVIGKQALIQYGDGVIVVRPLCIENALVDCVSTYTPRGLTTARERPKIRLVGTWLDACGFTPKKMALLEHEYGSISLRLRGEGQADYLQLAKSILKNRKGSLVYVTSDGERKSKKIATVIEITDTWLEAQGFGVHVPILVTAEQGAIDIRLLEDHAIKRATVVV